MKNLEQGRYYLVDRRVILRNRPIEFVQIHQILKDEDEVEVNFLIPCKNSSTKFYLPKPLEPEIISREYLKKKMTWVTLSKSGVITFGMLPNVIFFYFLSLFFLNNLKF